MATTAVIYPGLDLGNLKYLVVAPVLESMGLGGAAAINLVTGTALAESGGAYLRQRGGPALGLWQMEPFTHDDCWTNFLDLRKGTRLYESVSGCLAGNMARCDQLVANLRYACAMARLKYYRAPENLPAARDAAGHAAYHKRWYNSAFGAADALANQPHFQRAILA